MPTHSFHRRIFSWNHIPRPMLIQREIFAKESILHTKTHFKPKPQQYMFMPHLPGYYQRQTTRIPSNKLKLSYAPGVQKKFMSKICRQETIDRSIRGIKFPWKVQDSWYKFRKCSLRPAKVRWSWYRFMLVADHQAHFTTCKSQEHLAEVWQAQVGTGLESTLCLTKAQESL